MAEHDPVDHGRRALIGAGGALILSAALLAGARAGANRRQDAHRRHRLRPYRRHDRRAVGQGRPPVLFSSRHPEELKDLVAGLGANCRKPARSSRRLRSATSFSSPCRTERCRRSARITARRSRARSCSMPAMPSPRATAPIAEEVERDGIGVTSQKYLPGTRLVRAFNTLNYMIFAREANRPDPKLAVPIAGDDAEAVQVAAGLVRDAGFDPVVVGKLGRRAPLSARRAGIWPEGDCRRTQAEAVAGAMNRRNRSAAALAGRAVPATPQERAAALWSFAYFFTLLAGYYVLRPLRDQMGIAGGVRNLPWLFTATFVTLLVAQPLYGALVAKLPRAPVHSHRLSFLRRQHRVVLAVADARRRAGDRRAGVLRLGQRVQPVRGGGVLVVHGRSVHRRAGQAAVRLHWRRRHRRRAAGSRHHDRAVGAARPGQSVDRRGRPPRSRGVLRLPAR